MPKPQSGQIHVLLQIPKPTSPQMFPEGIIVQLPHLSRELVVEELLHDVLSAQFVPIISPARSGKTSLLNLFAARYPDVPCVPISLSNVNSVASDLLLRYGVDVDRLECTLPFHLRFCELVVFMLDDAQCEYEDSCFWERLIKGSLGWLPSNVRFVISTSHPVEAVVHDCYIAFEGFAWKLTRNDHLLSDDEARQLLHSKQGLRPEIRSSILEELIIREYNGHVGSLLNVVEGITRMHRITRCNEQDLVRFCLSDRLLKNIRPCFGKKIIAPSPPVAEFLAKTLVGELNYEPWQWSFEERQSLVSLKAAGFVATDKNEFIQFTSPLAKRYYSKWIFPCRGDAEPSSIERLIKQVIKTTSVSQLSEAAKANQNNFPSAAAFQLLFLQGLAQHLPPTCLIYPVIKREWFGGRYRFDNGIELWFKRFCWRIKLLVDGDDTATFHDESQVIAGENVSTYAAPIAREAVTIVIQSCQTGSQADEIKHTRGRILVSLKPGDFSRCLCSFGGNKDVETISFSP